MATTAQSDTAAILRQLEDDPAGGLLAAADLREQRARGADGDNWCAVDGEVYAPNTPDTGETYAIAWDLHPPNAVHLAAEANPAHALPEVALWRGIAERHRPTSGLRSGKECCRKCFNEPWPCPDLHDAVAAARAYLGGGQTA